MDTNEQEARISIQPFVKHITVMEERQDNKTHQLPFYADGFPGIVFLQTHSDTFLLPGMKKLSDFFLYGQTITPIEIAIEGSFKLIVFHLFPFTSKVLFGVNPKEINDDCVDPRKIYKTETETIVQQLHQTGDTDVQIRVMTNYLAGLIKKAINKLDIRIQTAVNLILESRGNLTVRELISKLHTTERTLQRQFTRYIGVSPKQFSKIIQFQFSLRKILEYSTSNLTEVVYEGGYTDQSHFIKDFKNYTGKNPSALKNSL